MNLFPLSSSWEPSFGRCLILYLCKNPAKNLKSVYIILSTLLLLIRNPQNNLLSSFQPKFVLQKVVLVPPPSNRPRSRKVFIDSALYFIVFIFQDAVDPLDVYNKYDIHIFRWKRFKFWIWFSQLAFRPFVSISS